MNPRRSLSQILNDNDKSKLRQVWDSTEPAADFKPLPPGEYIAHIVSGEWETSRNGVLSYKLSFQVIEGEYVGRRFWNDLYFSDLALKYSQRDLLKLGVTEFDQLDLPLPQGIRVRARLVIHKSDAGSEYNKLKTFDVLGIDRPEPDAFAPDEDVDAGAPSVESAPAAGGIDQHTELFPKPAERFGLPDVG